MDLAQTASSTPTWSAGRLSRTLARLAVAVSLAAVAVVLAIGLTASRTAGSSPGAVGSADWREFRAGEHQAMPLTATDTAIGSAAWRAFREGERAALMADPWLTPSVVHFRRSERDGR